ncbi:MAG: hypothetical protein E6I44_11450 [Chloroflexi bacterium]|nr:MAG: hypothetical protein E6I44_11450 [Chloroflexota bacterium]
MRGIWYLTLGCIAFVAITYFEQLPIIGWLGGLISVAAWVLIVRALIGERGFDFETPFGVGWAAVIGAVTGFVGAFTAWLAQTGNLVGLTTPPGDRFGAAFGFVGASIGIVLWPLFGAAVSAIATLASVRRQRAT